LPSGNAGSVMLVRVGDAFVVFLAIFVFVGVRVGIAAPPEFFDEPFTLVVGFQFLPGLALFVRDDIGHVLVEPVFVGFFQLNLFIPRLSGGVLTRLLLLFLREAGRNGKAKSQESNGQTAQSA